MDDTPYTVQHTSHLPFEIENLVHLGHVKDEASHGIVCNYEKFVILIKDKKDSLVGALQAYTAFAEVYVDDIWVSPDHRWKGLGKRLLEELENRFNGKGYNNINLVTNHFQSPEFYKKCGYEVEFVRENKKNPLLSKTFFIKYFDDEDQHQGTLGK